MIWLHLLLLRSDILQDLSWVETIQSSHLLLLLMIIVRI